MKRVFFLLLLLLAAPALRAQDDEPEQPRRRSNGGIFGGGGGVIPTWYFLKADVLNRELAGMGMPAVPEDGMFLMGGHGYAYIIIVPNLRVGGMGAGGGLESSRSENGVYRSTKLSTAFGGVTIEYVLPFGRFHVALGGLLGGGSYTLTLTEIEDHTKSWGDVGRISPLFNREELASTFFAYHPWLTLEIEVNPFIVASVTGGYYGSSGTSWTYNDHFDAQDVPDFSFQNLFVRAGLTIGLFIGE